MLANRVPKRENNNNKQEKSHVLNIYVPQVLHTIPRYHYYFHSTDEETKTQAGDAQDYTASHYWS